MHTYILTYILTHMHTYTHIHIHAYIHTYILDDCIKNADALWFGTSWVRKLHLETDKLGQHITLTVASKAEVQVDVSIPTVAVEQHLPNAHTSSAFPAM